MKWTIQERFFLFLSITCLAFYFTNNYFHYKIDRDIRTAIESGNDVAKRGYEISMLKTQAIDHWKSMYRAQKNYCISLETQINVVNEHWMKEYIKVNDQLFDLKHFNKSHLRRGDTRKK